MAMCVRFVLFFEPLYLVVVCKMLRCEYLSTVGNFHCHAGGQDEQADYNLQTANNGWKTLDFNIVPEVVTYMVTKSSASNATDMP